MTEKQLQNLLKEFRVPAHIRAHMEKVAMLARWLGSKLKKRGHKIDVIRLRQACLLHDLAKMCEITQFDAPLLATATYADVTVWKRLAKKYAKVGHVKAASGIMGSIGEEKLAKIILKHRFDALIDPVPSKRPSTWEEKLLYYADKRVMHDKIVTLKVRLKDGNKRYIKKNKVPANNAGMEKAVYTLENEICLAAGIRPEQLSETKIGRA